MRAYLRACLKTTSDPGQDKDYDIDTAVDQLFNETETCALAVHLMWAVWGFTQCINKENIAFGYLVSMSENYLSICIYFHHDIRSYNRNDFNYRRKKN